MDGNFLRDCNFYAFAMNGLLRSLKELYPLALAANNSPPGVVSHNRTSEQKILLYYREILRYDSGRYMEEEKRKKVEQISRVPEHKMKFWFQVLKTLGKLAKCPWEYEWRWTCGDSTVRSILWVTIWWNFWWSLTMVCWKQFFKFSKVFKGSRNQD